MGGARGRVARTHWTLPPSPALSTRPPSSHRPPQLTVIPDGVPVLSIEASHVHGWEKYAHASIGMTYFGQSAPGPDVYKALGITADAVKAKGTAMIAYFAGKVVPPVFLNMPTFA